MWMLALARGHHPPCALGLPPTERVLRTNAPLRCGRCLRRFFGAGALRCRTGGRLRRSSALYPPSAFRHHLFCVAICILIMQIRVKYLIVNTQTSCVRNTAAGAHPSCGSAPAPISTAIGAPRARAKRLALNQPPEAPTAALDARSDGQSPAVIPWRGPSAQGAGRPCAQAATLCRPLRTARRVGVAFLLVTFLWRSKEK